MPGFLYCKWCRGRGCLACEGERQQWESEEMAPLFIADMNNPNDLALAKSILSADVIDQIFAPDGGGIREFQKRALIAQLGHLLGKNDEKKEV